MFKPPIKPVVRMNNMQDLMNYSMSYEFTRYEEETLRFCSNNGQLAFITATGEHRVTPFMTEGTSILVASGYRSGSIFVPYSNGEKRPPEYVWLNRYCEQNAWAKTYVEAKKISNEKGIDDSKVEISSISGIKIHEISPHTLCIFETKCVDIPVLKINGFVGEYLLDGRDNIGTYIVLDEKSVVFCDEYGRTFLVTVKSVINDFVNALQSAGYTLTPNPSSCVEMYDDISKVPECYNNRFFMI